MEKNYCDSQPNLSYDKANITLIGNNLIIFNSSSKSGSLILNSDDKIIGLYRGVMKNNHSVFYSLKQFLIL